MFWAVASEGMLVLYNRVNLCIRLFVFLSIPPFRLALRVLKPDLMGLKPGLRGLTLGLRGFNPGLRGDQKSVIRALELSLGCFY